MPSISTLSARLFPALALSSLCLAALPLAAQRPGQQKGAPPQKEAGSEERARPAQKGPERLPVVGLHGTPSTEDENEPGERDPAFDLAARLKRGRALTGATGSAANSGLQRLASHPRREDLARWLEDALRGKEIDVALLGGHKYMINSCLGVKASAGEFRLKLENPALRFENSGLVLTLEIDRVSFSALKLRMRPNPNPVELCKFSKKFEVGGAMEDVRLTLRLDPLYDYERCRVGSWGELNPEVRIGNLNLKPLQNDLDKMAKNMVEDALTFALQVQVDGMLSALGDLLLSGIDQFLEADCPTKPGESGRALGRVTGVVGGAASGGANTGGTSGSGASAPAGSGPATAELEALQVRIRALEERIAELESGAPPPADLRTLLELVIERLGSPDAARLSRAELSDLLARLLAVSCERAGLGAPGTVMDELTRLVLEPRQHAAEPVGTSANAAASGSAGWSLVPNPELKGRMGRVLVRFPDAKLAGATLVQLDRDGKKVADVYGEAVWELLPGVHDVLITRARVAGLEVRAGHDTLVQAGLLSIELGAGTLFRVFPKGGQTKLFDTYGSATIGLPVGEYEVEIQDQRAAVSVRAGEITRF